MNTQKPSLGRIVLYTLTTFQAQEVNRSIAHGEQHGNSVKEGQTFPMIVTAVWGDTPDCYFNGTCFLDGDRTWWVASTSIGEGPGKAIWPPRV